MNIEVKVKNTDWFTFHKRHRSIFLQTILIGPGIRNKKIPFDHRIRFFGDFCDYILIDKLEKQRLADRTIKHMQKDPLFLIKLMNMAYQQLQDYEKQWQKLKNADYRTHSNIHVANGLKRYMDQLLAWGVYVSLPLFVESYMETTLQDSFKRLFGDRAEEYFSIVVDPVKDGSVLEEEIDLLKLACKSRVSEKDLQKHCDKYNWMANVGYMETYYPISYYQRRLKKFKTGNPVAHLKGIIKHRQEHRKKLSALLNKLKHDRYLQILARTANEAVYFRSFRTEMYYSSAKVFTPLFKESARRVGLKQYRDVLWMYPEEIYALLKRNKKADFELIQTRKKGFSFLTDFEGRYWKWDRKDAFKILKLYKQSEVLHTKTSQITGSPAYSGISRGRVAVIHSLPELTKVRKGDILVANATNVNFVTALKKVAGIVTEEGGILSHAAIISREMRIPCVIGTKIATQVFKDGDMVEVDANKGVVKKLT